MAGFMWLGSSVPAGYFAATDGSSSGAGTFADPWTLETAFDGGNPAGTIQPGDTVWIRGGTYTGQFTCALNGSAGHYITFRTYPGERATIDGNYDPNVTGNANPTLLLNTAGSYLIIRDIEIINSNTYNDRICTEDLHDSRGDDLLILSHHSKVINCVLHDGGEALWPSASAPGSEVYGNLVYYEGEWAPTCGRNSAVSVDLADDGTAVALSGATSGVDNPAPISPDVLTFSHTHTGNYLLVGAYVNDEAGLETDLSATYDGVSMTRLNGTHYQGNYTGGAAMALFGLATTNTGAHDVAVTYANAGHAIRGRAQSFSNVASASAGGVWNANRYDTTPRSADTSSAADHIVVDYVGIFNAYWEVQDYAPYGDNAGHMIGGAVTGLNPVSRMSWAVGGATVSMAWNWTRMLYPHGHGMYAQEGLGTGGLVTNSGDNTITIDPESPEWKNGFSEKLVGGTIYLYGAGPDGADLKTTITAYNAYLSIEVETAPSMTLTEAFADWYTGKTISNNIWLDQVNFGSQFYGSSDARFMGSTVEGNLWAFSNVDIGGLTGFKMTDSVFRDNYTWDASIGIGYQMAHMTNVSFVGNYVDVGLGLPTPSSKWEDMVVGTGDEKNTIIGTHNNWGLGDFPNNIIYDRPPYPTTNVVVVRPNAYEANRCNVYVYNWENLANVAVDLSSVVTVGTPIYVINAQDYYAAPVITTTYAGGTLSFPMTGLTKAAGVAYTPHAWSGQGFNCFIVRAQSTETWR